MTDDLRAMASKMVDLMQAAAPDWFPTVRQRLARGETFAEWRRSFEPLRQLPSVLGAFQRMEKNGIDTETFLRHMWEISRERALAEKKQ